MEFLVWFVHLSENTNHILLKMQFKSSVYVQRQCTEPLFYLWVWLSFSPLNLWFSCTGDGGCAPSCPVWRRRYGPHKLPRWGSNDRSCSSCMANSVLTISLLCASLNCGREPESLVREHRQTQEEHARRAGMRVDDAPCQTLLDVMNLRSHLDKSRRDLTRRDAELRLACVGAQICAHTISALTCRKIT